MGINGNIAIRQYTQNEYTREEYLLYTHKTSLKEILDK